MSGHVATALDRDLPEHVVTTAASLTGAELNVLRCLPTHHTLHEIGELLDTSGNTAKRHVVSIYRKLGVSTRSEAVTRAEQLGFLPPAEIWPTEEPRGPLARRGAAS